MVKINSKLDTAREKINNLEDRLRTLLRNAYYFLNDDKEQGEQNKAVQHTSN